METLTVEKMGWQEANVSLGSCIPYDLEKVWRWGWGERKPSRT